jgi:hypothetical protein
LDPPTTNPGDGEGGGGQLPGEPPPDIPGPPGTLPPTPDPPPPSGREGEDRARCAAGVANTISAAALAGVDDTWLGNALGGNDIATASNLITDFDWGGLWDNFVSNPTPLNLTARLTIAAGQIKVGVGPADVRTTPGGTHYVRSWPAKKVVDTGIGWQVAKVLNFASKWKLVYDIAAYGRSWYECGK